MVSFNCFLCLEWLFSFLSPHSPLPTNALLKVYLRHHLQKETNTFLSGLTIYYFFVALLTSWHIFIIKIINLQKHLVYFHILVPYTMILQLHWRKKKEKHRIWKSKRSEWHTHGWFWRVWMCVPILPDEAETWESTLAPRWLFSSEKDGSWHLRAILCQKYTSAWREES